MQPLKLIAFDTVDLEIMSAHLQDAVLRVDDMAYVPAQHRFAAIANRFDWEDALGKRDGGKQYRRRRSALRFERVLAAQVQNIDLDAKGAVLELLAIRFEPGEAPSGAITLVFAGGGAIRLDVECVEAELSDLGAAWRAARMPSHVEDDDQPPPEP